MHMRIEPCEHRTFLSGGAGASDPTFGDYGRLVGPFGADVHVNDIAVQSDGKVVVAGSIGDDETADFFVAQLRADGSIDESFGHKGKIRTSFSSGPDGASRVAIDGDGKIVVSGGAESRFAIARYQRDGTLDSSFNGDGKRLINFGKNDSAIAALAIQPDGRIVVAGGGRIARLTHSGALDNTFDGDGKRSLGAEVPEIDALSIAPDHKIVVGGFRHGEMFANGTFVRLNGDGSIDSTFARHLKVNPPLRQLYLPYSPRPGYLQFLDAAPEVICVRPDGRIVWGGVSNLSDPEGEVGEISADGNHLASWGNPFGGESVDESASQMILQHDGKVIAAFDPDINGRHTALVRYDPSGKLDRTFGMNGVAHVRLDGDGPMPTAIASSPGNKVVVAGFLNDLGADSFWRYDASDVRYAAPFTIDAAQLSITGTSSSDRIEYSTFGLRINADEFELDVEKRAIIHGGAGNDLILNHVAGSVVYGDSGNDDIHLYAVGIAHGGSGNDRLFGSKGNDQLFGDDGNDRMTGNGGSDTLDGGHGSDIGSKSDLADAKGRALNIESFI
jgi:uncharacterized delta-60 repeat protein